MRRHAPKAVVVLACTLLSACGGGGGGGGVGSDQAALGCQAPDLRADVCGRVLALRLPASLPEARGNEYGDDEDAATLGFHLFFDAELGTGVGCVNCHAPEGAFTDRASVSTGKGKGTRNAPTVFNAARLHVFFWDGRADSLWSQPLLAIENPVEMGSSRLEIAHFIADDPTYRAPYEQVFGALPDMTAWPAEGKPGDAAFDSLSDDVKTEVDRVAANVGKALEADMRKNATGSSPFDAYLDGDPSKFIDAARLGVEAFVDDGCITCHNGPMLTDEAFHDVGFPSLPGAAPDPGRAGGTAVLLSSPFNLGGAFADPNTGATSPIIEKNPMSGAFRTPSLRNVAHTAPYGHDGALPTLDDVLEVHAERISDEDRGHLIAFLQTLSGDTPPRPWSTWPVPQ